MNNNSAGLRFERVTSIDCAAAKDVIGVYEEAFCEAERYSFSLLMESVVGGRARLIAFYDGDLFVGFVYLVPADSFVFVFYFAVSWRLRSRGYGSKILSVLYSMEEYRGVSFILNSETPGVKGGADENALMARRIAFYERNGFVSVGWRLDDSVSGVLFTVLCRGTFDADAYGKFLDLMNEKYGFTSGDLYRVEE